MKWMAVPMAILVAGCSTKSASQPLTGTGSSFIAPAMARWQSAYGKDKLTYESVGSLVGVQRLNTGAFDFACTDVPLDQEQRSKARKARGAALHIPLVLAAVVPAYNLEGLKTPLTFSGPVLADIYLGKITRWNDKAIADLNPGSALPDQPIIVIHRTDGSGTSHIWTDFLSRVSPEWRNTVGVGVSVLWPVGVSGTGNEGTSSRLQKTPGAIAYLPMAHALDQGLSIGRVKNHEGAVVAPTLDSVTAAAHAVLTTIPEDLCFSLTDAPGKDSFPICGATWAVVFVKQPPGKEKDIVQFLRWATHEGQEYLAELQYARLPPGLVERIDKKLTEISASPL
jgi:phosphate transport system substrate-binding protein